MEPVELLEAVECGGVWSEQWVLCIAEYVHEENGGYSYRLFGEGSDGWLPASHVRQSRAAD